MGNFSLFGKKRQEEAGEAEFMKALNLYQVESRANGVDADDIPEACGPFCHYKTIPLPTKSVIGSKAHLESLRAKDWRRAISNRMESTSAEEVTEGMVDVYRLSADGQAVATDLCVPVSQTILSKSA